MKIPDKTRKGPGACRRWLLALAVLAALGPAARAAQDGPAGAAWTPPAVAAELARLVHGSGHGRVGVAVAELPSGRMLFEHRSAERFVPASNQKLLVAHAVLARLGPEGGFWTPLYRRGRVEAGTLWGDLYVVGRGDPGLSTGQLYEMAAALRRAGIERIAGDLVVDDSYFFLPQPQYVGGAQAKIYFAPKGALSLNFNTVGISVLGTLPGQPALVWTDAPGSFVEVRGRVLTRPATHLSVSRQALQRANRFSLGGSVAEGGRERLVRAITEPTQYFVQTFLAVLGELGVALSGRVRHAELPPDAVELHRQSSVPVADLVHEMNKASNNFIADQLVLELGALRSGGPATWPKALAALREHAASLGLETTEVDDGSGLSAQNRTSPADLIRLLRSAYASGFRAEFVASLPIGGRDGTLKNRLGAPGVFGRVRGKTGTITGASTLSGYVFRDDGRVLAYSILVNGHKAGPAGAQNLQDRLVEAMVLGTLD